jgi:hypothetical protein
MNTYKLFEGVSSSPSYGHSRALAWFVGSWLGLGGRVRRRSDDRFVFGGPLLTLQLSETHPGNVFGAHGIPVKVRFALATVL